MAYNTLAGSGVKSINRYSKSFTAGSGSTTQTITAVSDIGKASVNLLTLLGDNQGNETVSLELTSTTEVTLHYSTADFTGPIYFEVIEVY